MSAQMLAATAKKDAAATAGGTGPAGNPIGELLYCFFSHIFIFIFFFFFYTHELLYPTDMPSLYHVDFLSCTSL